MKHKSDDYIENYRKNMDKALALSGEESTFFAEYKAQKLAEWLPNLLQKPLHIIDFGCGDGLMTQFVQHNFPAAKLYGVDPSQDSIEEARELHPSIQFEVSDEQIPFESSSFDLVYAAGVFHHIDFEEHTKYAQEIMRILKPHGIFILFELNPLNPLTVITFKRNPIDKHAQMMFHWYSNKLLKKWGATQTKFYCFFPRFLHTLRFLEPYMTWLPFGALYATLVVKE